MILHESEGVLMRHLDKGKWEYNEQELAAAMPAEEAALLKSILQEAGYENQALPLELNGLKRGIEAGNEIYNRLPQRCVLVTIDSKKPRADLSENIISARIGQLESKYEKDEQHAKRIDMIHVEESELADLLQDEGTDTWDKFAEMMKTEGISESAAIARQVNAIDQPGIMVPGKENYSEAAARYYLVLEQLKARIKTPNVPMVILGVGHSGPLAAIKHQAEGRDLNEEDAPKFAQMFTFGDNYKLVDESEIKI